MWLRVGEIKGRVGDGKVIAGRSRGMSRGPPVQILDLPSMTPVVGTSVCGGSKAPLGKFTRGHFTRDMRG